MTYSVWAVPPGEGQSILFASFPQARWQWAEKLAQYLRDTGYQEVEVKET